ncbi:acyl-CoA dehydrogenase family protein [Hoeflea sp. TYP-13]|uniref:acyl-CoA dehydrogenase family protein n=1 Tax=Hoeflea sp. TYP-13 TaxID=3230023 RepID=UPI0034C6CF05
MDTSGQQAFENDNPVEDDHAPAAGQPAKSPENETLPGHSFGRCNMRLWMDRIADNVYLGDADFRHTVRYHLGMDYAVVHDDLAAFGARIPTELEPAVAENDSRFNNPTVQHYNGIGERDDRVIHHPSYARSGNIIYETDLVARLATIGGLREGMSFYFLSNHAGEAGHNCPVICNFETARLLRAIPDFPGRDDYVARLEVPSYDDNMTASQFLTEVQGGSDVGANATMAWQDDGGNWRIRGEKWFCSNADADLLVISARYDEDQPGTKGLAVFMIPERKPDGSRNDYTFRRLKEKMGTRPLASSEIDFHDAYAIALGPVDRGFNRLMEMVIHHSRIALATAVLGFANRAYQIARAYADTRHAFGSTIIDYPLVRENLATIKAEIVADIAGTFSLIAMQDKIDLGKDTDAAHAAFVRLMSNLGKSVISRRVVDCTHHAIDAMGGNGAIETTSNLPRLFRESVILENWEGSHNTLYMQVLRDIHKYGHDEAYFSVMTEEAGKLPESLGEEKQAVQGLLEALKSDVDDLKASSHDLQTLKIQHVAERMCDIFYYVSALREGDHQRADTGSDSKLAGAEYFRQIRLTGEPVKWDEDYLGLIERVVSA